MIHNIERRTIGLNFGSNGPEFRLWSPLADKVEIEINESATYKCLKIERGYWSVLSNNIRPGDHYKVRIDGANTLPDPASLSQPYDVQGPSEAVDLNSYEWHDNDWKGLDEECIFYEIHTGTFSESGDFTGIADKLDYLTDLGINTIEIMPVAQFPGERNWGYDGVFPFAVHQSYGGYRSLMRLVDECHGRGLAVILDVVYNHLGPEGNYLNEFGPYFTDDYKTPWGKAINFDGKWSDGVRYFYTENMLMWLRDFHLDGLRFDAVHAIKDFGPKHIIRHLREKADELEKSTGRKYLLIGETDLNDTKFISSYDKGGFKLDKQWCDEFHHALHAVVTGEKQGYYADFGLISHLVKSFKNAYVYDGIWSEHRKRTFGSSTKGIQGNKFVVFTQNHDHIGNRMKGERLGRLIEFEMLKVVAGAMFISPFNPLIFMGEEYNESAPFLYFTSHTDKALAEAVSKGRRQEFPEFINSDEFPEPQSESVFKKSRLSFDLSGNRNHLFSFYREMIRLKKTHPLFKIYDRSGIYASEISNKAILFTKKSNGKHLIAVMNFDTEDLLLSLPELNKSDVLLYSADKLWGGSHDGRIPHTENSMILFRAASIVIYSDLISY